MKILVCDDSAVARKSIVRSIGDQPTLSLFEAEDGHQALQIMQCHNIDALFLDLTMPVMDGFALLEALPVNPYPTDIIVFSADVQEQAKTRCRQLGAKHFISKPFYQAEIEPVFQELGLTFNQQWPKADCQHSPEQKFKEVANIALGKGAAIMANHLDHFIELPIPHVGYLTYSELAMTMMDVLNQPNSTAVTQRFVGGEIHGEAFVCLRGKHILDIGNKLGYRPEFTQTAEIYQNIANLLVSSFLLSLGTMLDKTFSLRQPAILSSSALQQIQSKDNEQLFAIEYTCLAEALDFECEVLFLVDKPSVEVILGVMENI
ncbi:response regulator [Vibrio agarivorans]|uniref:Response regulator n=1 Tax=Vibrio agarivorans TaxID=153622 RepID=A0ABT7Y6Y0_9VIBR|nr:response regulator [Vibrio agarivorans]MDN2483753.1 response regulator [Vibrio agarivorans]